MQFKIAIETDWRLTKNGMKRTPPRTLQGLTRRFREKAHKLASQKKSPTWQTLSKADILITSYYARRPMDYDGLACSVAPVIDGLVDAGILEDDSPNHVENYSMKFVKVPKMKDVKVKVCISSVRDS